MRNNNKQNKKKNSGKKLAKANLVVMKQTRRRKLARLDPIAQLVMDPCNANLKLGIYGSVKGMATRVHRISSIGNGVTGTTDNSGYILWFPDYHCPGGTTTAERNCFLYNAVNVLTGPAAAGFGCGAANGTTTTSSMNDPAYSFVESDVCQDARTLAACMRVTYTGTTSNARGLIYPLVNVPADAIIRGGASTTPPSPSDLIAYARESKRCVGTNEVRWRPTGSSLGFKDNLPGPIQCNSATAPTLNSSVRNEEPVAIGFVWYNVSSPNDLQVDFYKAIEWRAEPTSLLSSAKPIGADNTSVMQRVTNALDRIYPQWQTHAMEGAMDLASSMLQTAVLSGTQGNANLRGIEFR